MTHHHLCTCNRCQVIAEEHHEVTCGCPCCDIAKHPMAAEDEPIDWADDDSEPDETAILALQSHAVITSDIQLLYLTYAALGIDRANACYPVTVEQQAAAVRGCASMLQMMTAMGEAVRS